MRRKRWCSRDVRTVESLKPSLNVGTAINCIYHFDIAFYIAALGGDGTREVSVVGFFEDLHSFCHGKLWTGLRFFC